MNLILYDIGKDAIAKSASANIEDRILLIEAASHALMLAGIARREGLLALEKAAAVKAVTPDYLNQIIALIVDGRDPERVLEIAANGYWRQAPQGIHAMVRYFYIRSMLLVQAGEDPYLIEDMLLSLVPDKWQEGFREQIGQKKELLEQARQKEIIETFCSIRPAFQDEQLLEELHVLEADILGLSGGSLQNVLRNTGMDTLTVCLYACREECRKKIIRNISRMRSEMFMQDIIWRGRMIEQEVLAAVQRMNDVISRLRKSGEIV